MSLKDNKLTCMNCGVGDDSWESLGQQGDKNRIFIGRLILRLKLQYFGHLMQRSNSLKTLMLWEIEGRRRRGQQRTMVGWHHRLNGHEFEQSLGDSEGQRSLVCAAVHGVAKSRTWLSNWTTKDTQFFSLLKLISAGKERGSVRRELTFLRLTRWLGSELTWSTK